MSAASSMLSLAPMGEDDDTIQFSISGSVGVSLGASAGAGGEAGVYERVD